MTTAAATDTIAPASLTWHHSSDSYGEEWSAKVEFGCADRFGRTIGCCLLIERRVPQPATSYRGDIPELLLSSIQSTRNGKKYGASPARKAHELALGIEPVKVSLAKRATASLRSQRKAHAQAAK